jgi:addiction module HigA family antidote
LKDDRKGQHSIRINDPWRVCFVWKGDGARQVEIVDHHREWTMTKLLDEIHPGEVLLEDFMQPMAISARRLAADIDVSPSRISELVNGARPITADTALRLGLFFSMEPRFWLNLQSEYDMRMAVRETKAAIEPRIRVFHADAA